MSQPDGRDLSVVSRLTKHELLELFRRMQLIRRFEEKTAEMYQRGKISGFCHLYIGEEAVAVGLEHVLTVKDYVIDAYRDHGHAITRGMDPRHVMAELYGRADGVSRGRGGSMHLYSRELKFFGGDAIVGGQIAMSTGLGFAVRYRREDAVVACIFGDGAINEGTFHEGMNLASLWNLPIVFVCENNEFGMGTAVQRASAFIDLSKRALGYNMRIDKVDGMDVLAVIEVADRAVRYVKSQQRPTFIEARTYRFRGHSMSDPQRYRTREDVGVWRQRDPVKGLQQRMIDSGQATEDEFKRIRSEIEQQMKDVIEFAENSPKPSLDALTDFAFATYAAPDEQTADKSGN